MARGRQLSYIMLPEEFEAALDGLLKGENLHGFISKFPPKELRAIGSNPCHSLLDPPSRGSLVYVREQPIASDEASLRVYDDSMIAQGFVQIDAPEWYLDRGLKGCCVLVGTDPPAEGILSPIPLFLRIKKHLNRYCPVKGGDVEPRLKGFRLSPGFVAYREAGKPYVTF